LEEVERAQEEEDGYGPADDTLPTLHEDEVTRFVADHAIGSETVEWPMP
jgi:hypothetical protein